MISKAIVTTIAAVIGVVCQGAAAQTYPSRPITLVVPYSTGGTADISARVFGAVAQKHLGQPLVVVNKPGASGVIGSKFVLDAPSDGYTLLAGRVSSQVALPALEPKKVPYPWDAFSTIGLLEFNPAACLVRAESPYKTVHELLEAIKARPSQLNAAVGGTADASAAMTVVLLRDYGLPPDAVTRVLYKGGGDMLTAVLRGEVDFTCNAIPPYLGSLRSGLVRALVVTSNTRLSSIPDTPTPVEVSLPGLQAMTAWGAIFGPPNLPKDVMAKWEEVLSKVAHDPEWIRQLERRDTLQGIRTMSPDDERKFLASQYKQYKSLASLLPEVE